MSLSLVLPRLESEALFLGNGEGHAKLEELKKDVGEILEEGIVVPSVLVDVLLEGLVLDQRHVGGKHHQCFGLGVLKLLRSVPLAPVPLLLYQKFVVVVGESGWRKGPGAIEARTIGVATSKGMSTGQCDDLLVVESHAVEDAANVVVTLGSVGKTTVWSAEGQVAIGAAWSPWDNWALHLLDGGDGCEGPKI
jgi:hypothetical protein